MWTLYGFGITFVILLSYQGIYARVLPELPDVSKESTESSKADTNSLLDQVSASKLECLLEFIETPDAKLQCIDKHFGDERSQYLLDELRSELKGNFLPEEEIEAGDAQDQNEDQLVADLNTLSDKSAPVSTVNDDIPIINSDIQKRVDEQVDTPKKEQQRNALGQDIPEVTAEVVKSDEEEENTDENQIEDDNDEYEYDSSLVSKLYNMLQEMVMKETFDYGLNMNEDDDDSDEEEPQNLDENTTAAEESQQQEAVEEDESDSEEEEDEETGKYANELGSKSDSNEGDELGNELKQMHGAHDDGSEEEDEQEDNVDAIENDLVKELDKMLRMAKQAIAAKKNTKEASDEIVSSDKFLDDLRNMEKALKDSST